MAFTYNYVIENELGMFIDYLKFIEKVEAPDATHVVFTCSKPKANMLGLWIPILPEHIWSTVPLKTVEKSFENPPPIVGSGPFQTVEWKKGEYVRMVANKDYWKGAPKIDEVIFQTYQNSDTMAQDLKTGALQTAWNIPGAQFEPLGKRARASRPSAGQLPGFDQLGFNCADKKVYPKSTGHPVLQDAAFRRALQWAVDKDKIVAVAYQAPSHVRPRAIIQPDFYPTESDFHWQPPAGDPDTYTFDLERAEQELDAAGYTDTDGNGIREYEGKDITLRLYARTESAESQSCGKLITGWFEERRPRHRLRRSSTTAAWATCSSPTTATTYAPDFDLFIWGWGGDIDPNFILSIMTTSSIEALERLHLVQRGVRRPLPATADARSTSSSASRSCTGCSRSSTRSRRTSCSSTRSSSRPTTPPSGRGGCRRTAKAWSGTTPCRTPTSRCTRRRP